MIATKSAFGRQSQKNAQTALSLHLRLKGNGFGPLINGPLGLSMTARRPLMTLSRSAGLQASVSSPNLTSMNLVRRSLATDHSKPSIDEPGKPKKASASSGKESISETSDAQPKKSTKKTAQRSYSPSEAQRRKQRLRETTASQDGSGFEFIKAEEGKHRLDRNF